MKRAWKVTTPPTEEPVTVADARAELGVTEEAYSDLRLLAMIRGARALAEAFTNRAFITQGITLQLDVFPDARVPWWDGVRDGSRREFASGGSIMLPRPPCVSVESVRWYDDANDEHVVDPLTYYLDSISEPARLVLAVGKTWPPFTRPRAGVSIEFKAGYGEHPALVPPEVRDAIIAHVRDVVERPNAAVSSESIDNASVTYGALRTGAAAAEGPDQSGGLRGGAATLLAPLRVHDLGV